jgi:hypothetical protein
MENNGNTGHKTKKSRPTVSTRPYLFHHSPVAHAVAKEQRKNEGTAAGGLNRPGKINNLRRNKLSYNRIACSAAAGGPQCVG